MNAIERSIIVTATQQPPDVIIKPKRGILESLVIRVVYIAGIVLGVASIGVDLIIRGTAKLIRSKPKPYHEELDYETYIDMLLEGDQRVFSARPKIEGRTSLRLF